MMSYFKRRKGVLFAGSDELFKKLVVGANVYAEYGCGDSTIWVANNTRCKIFSVDSSDVWLDKVKRSCINCESVTLHFADVGKVGEWGRPLNYDKHENFDDYTDWFWKQGISPDIVLIDGRFRVCCFLTSLLFAKEGTLIFFDDYDREQYHFVELFLKPTQTCGRQALFVVPNKKLLDFQKINEAIRQFRFVFD